MVEVQYPQIEGYEFLSILGEGGMGRVYRALRKSDGRQVAVKVIHPSFYEGEYEDCLERFRREIEVSKNLSHPSIVLVLDGGWGKADNNPFIVMELLEGQSLGKAVREKPLSNSSCLTISVQLAEALAYVHERGLVHRDIKPDNVFIEKNGPIKLLDFGIVLDTSQERLTKTGVMLGTLLTIAPEVLRAERPSPASDIYSLGVTLYHAATGRLPYDKNEVLMLANKAKVSRPPSPKDLNPEISPTLSKIIMKCCSRKVEERYQNGSEFLQAIETSNSIVALNTVETPAQATSKEVKPAKSRKPLLWIMFFLLLCITLVLHMNRKEAVSNEVAIINASDLVLLRESLLKSEAVPSTEDATNLGFVLRMTGVPEEMLIPKDDDDEILGMRYLGEYTFKKKEFAKSVRIMNTLLERRGPYSSVEKYSLTSSTIMGRSLRAARYAKQFGPLLKWLRKFRKNTEDLDSQWREITQFWFASALSYSISSLQEANTQKECVEEATAVFEKLLKKKKYKTEYFEAYCFLLAELGDLEKRKAALELLEDCLARMHEGSNESRMRIAFGTMLLNRPNQRYKVIYSSHVQKAIKQLKLAIPLTETRDRNVCSLHLCKAYRFTNNIEGAREVLDGVNMKELDNEMLNIYIRERAHLFRAENRFDEADKVYLLGIKLLPEKYKKHFRSLRKETLWEKTASGLH